MLSGLGTTEVVIIASVLMVLFGGKKLPELARGMGDAVREFKRAIREK
jgi:sec-independent protein translocase protein TatA